MGSSSVSSSEAAAVAQFGEPTTGYIIGVDYLPKLAAIISIFCSTLLVAEVRKDFKKSRRKSSSGGGRITNTNNTHNSIISRILLSISVADIIFSL